MIPSKTINFETEEKGIGKCMVTIPNVNNCIIKTLKFIGNYKI